MKFILMRKADTHTEQGEMPSETVLQAMADYNEQMLNAGVLVSGNGIRPTAEGYRITFEGGEAKVTQGPFTPIKEQLAGYTLLEADSVEEALHWAQQWPREDVSDGNLVLELRRFYEMSDFEPGAALSKHLALESRLALQPSAVAPYLIFPGTCAEAMSFYADVLGGQVEASLRYGDTPMAAEVPAHWQDKIIHASLNLGAFRIMASDAGPDNFQPAQGASVCLSFDDVATGERAFQQLAQQGQVTMPFEATFWSPGFGMVTDRFGTPWMISVIPGDSCDGGPTP